MPPRVLCGFRGGAGHDTQRSFTDSHTAYLSIFLRVTRLGEKTTLAAATRVSLEKKKKKKKRTQQGSVSPDHGALV